MYALIENVFPNLIEKYNIEYDIKEKILEIKSTVLIKDFYCFKKLKELYPTLIQEIRISQNGLFYY